MPLYESGPTTQYNSQASGAIPNDLHPYAINYLPNRNPVYTRFPHVPVESATVTLFNDDYRPRSFPLTAAFVDGSGTTLTIADTSYLDVGDVIQVELERIQVTAIVSATTATVTRGYGGTTGAAHSNSTVCYLETNARTGAEINQAGMSRLPVGTLQYSQTIQHAYSVGGALNAKNNFMGGTMTPLQRDVEMAMQHVGDDFESALYYGVGQSVSSATARPEMKGFNTLITTNRADSPSDAATYKVGSMIRDLIAPITAAGGNPSVLLVSSIFQGGFATWGNQLERLNAGQTDFGIRVNLFYAPFLAGGVSVIYCPLLRSGTAICLTAEEVQVGIAREMFNKPRGSRGDAIEGDVILEGTLLLGNQQHHSIVTGVTAFAAG